jgi:hypothetical protein
MEFDLNTLADTYLRHYANHRDEDFWAFQELDRIIRKDRGLDRAWEITLLLRKRIRMRR